MNDVIAAIATAKAPSAIGIIRLSGEGCAQVAQQVFTLKSGKPLAEAPVRKLLLGTALRSTAQLHGRGYRGAAVSWLSGTFGFSARGTVCRRRKAGEGRRIYQTSLPERAA